MTFEIEKGIPVSKPTGRNGSPPKYPWADMEVGDSFFIDEPSSKRSRNAMNYRNRRYPNTKFASRSMDGGRRIWRIK